MQDVPYIVEATRDTFPQLVLERSHQVPVVVDFWAGWCNPCRILMPLLDKLAQEYQGGFQLAKVNSDEQQELAAQYGVRSLPTVKIFRNGTVVDEFMGAQPESVIREIIGRYLERKSDKVRPAVAEALQSGDPERALDLLRGAVESDPENYPLKVEFAALLLETGDTEAAVGVLKTLPANIQESDEVRGLLMQSEFARVVRDVPDPQTLEQQIAADAADLDARYRLGAVRLMEGNYEAALEQFFEIMQRDRGFNDDAGRRGLVSAFELIGNDDELVNRYRRRMAALLH